MIMDTYDWIERMNLIEMSDSDFRDEIYGKLNEMLGMEMSPELKNKIVELRNFVLGKE